MPSWCISRNIIFVNYHHVTSNDALQLQKRNILAFLFTQAFDLAVQVRLSCCLLRVAF